MEFGASLPKSPMNLARGDEVPQIITRRTRQQPSEFLTSPAKRLLLPAEKIMGLLVNPANPMAKPVSEEVHTAAGALGLELRVVRAQNDDDIEAAFAELHATKVGALVIGTDPLFTSRAEKLGELSLRSGLPAIYQYREFTAAGGVMSYGGNIMDSYYRAGLYAGRILKGEKPSDLPVQLSTKVELFLNLKSARQLGLSVPLPLIGRADEVIE
jgi:putative ABC transport system substrate-binding protein